MRLTLDAAVCGRNRFVIEPAGAHEIFRVRIGDHAGYDRFLKSG